MANNYPTIRPTLSHNYAGMGVLPPDVTFTRASQSGGYYDGKTVAKAEENLFINSVWAGAVSGTPGTVPTSWTSVLNGGSLAVSGAAIEFTALTGTRQAIAQTITVVAGQVITASIDVDAASGTGTDAIAIFEVVSGATLTGTTQILVSGGTGRKSLSATCTVGGTIRVRFGAAVNTNAATDCVVTLKAPQIEIRSFATAYTPTTTAPITNYIPKMLFAPANVPVFDHNPVTGESLGLSVWEARTNLLLRSQEFETTWTNEESSEATNVAIAPDGTLTADRLIPNTNNVGHWINQTVTVTAVAHTFSFFAKPDGYSVVQVLNSNSGSDRINFNLATGIVGSASAAYTGTMTNVGNGWYRCSATFTPIVGTAGWARIGIVPDSTSARAAAFAGNGTSGVLIWGAQLEAGSFATPYIPTVASTVARSADVPVMTGVNFSRWFNAAEGTFVVEGLSNNTGNARYVMTSNTSGDNRLMIYTDGASGITASATTNGVTQALLARTGLTITNFNKFAFSYKTDDFAAVGNGGAVGTDTLGVVPPAATLHIGVRENGATQLSGHLKSLSYYPTRLTNAQLQAVTA